MGCRFPTPSEQLSCETSEDCGDRVCDNGFCIVAPPDSAPPIDTMPPDTTPDADPFLAIAAQCMAVGYTLDATTNGYYRPVAGQGVAQTFLGAQADCKDDVADATHLIVLTTTEEVTYMNALLANDAWVGLHDRTPPSVEGTFVTVTGETGDQRPFLPGEPNNGGGNEDCTVMRGGGGLDDVPCGNTFRYICECDGKTSAP